MVTSRLLRSTLMALTSGCLRNVFSIAVAQKPQTIPLTVALIVSAGTVVVRPIATMNANRYFLMISSSKLYGPVDHDVFVAAVTDLKPVGFVEEAEQRRCHEVIVLRRMM